MTTFLLIRHGLHDFGGDKIAGRTPGVHLSPAGFEQATKLASSLKEVVFDEILCSPMERTCETASLIAEGRSISPTIAPDLIELGFGDWSGKALSELKPQERWKQFNDFRSGTRAPHGELMLETQLRIVNFMSLVHDRLPDGTVALVSHGDVIKSALAYWLGVPLDLFLRIEISCASVSVVQLADYGPWVKCVNALNFSTEIL